MKASPLTRRHIRPAAPADIPSILEVMEEARGIMRNSGNPHQWSGRYPSRESLLEDIRREGGFVVEEAGGIIGYFAMLPSPEPTYDHIEGGAWLCADAPYAVIHRIASRAGKRGVLHDVLGYAFSRQGNIRIDTHRDNAIMRHLLEKEGFCLCGTIYLASGDPRLAYQKILP